MSLTGLQPVDLPSDAAKKVRSEKNLAEEYIREGLVGNMFKKGGLGSKSLFIILKEIQKIRCFAYLVFPRLMMEKFLYQSMRKK